MKPQQGSMGNIDGFFCELIEEREVMKKINWVMRRRRC